MSSASDSDAAPDIRVSQVDILARNHGTLRRATFEQRRRDGSWQTVTRETYDHGNGAVILLVDPARHTVLLTRQFRYPAYQAGHRDSLIEVVAGLLDHDNATPEETVRREAEEEAGCRVSNVRHLFDAFSSPGVMTERLSYFVADYSPTDRIHDGGGLHHEGEDIEVLELPLDDALAMIEQGKIVDAKTITLLYYAKLHALA